uniref:Ig-like domain-containing protein n=1 Tax=Mola mola TaxID=94237 RepID=A0A3Q3W880_MOLML
CGDGGVNLSEEKVSISGNTSPTCASREGFFVLANVGEKVTMPCFYQGLATMLSWYKQHLGKKPRLISNFNKFEKSDHFRNEFKNSSRFILNTGEGKNHLTIFDLHISDSATYYCAGLQIYNLEFGEGYTISVKGSGLNVPALLHQSASQTIQPGGSVTVNCTVQTGTCDGQQSVYWFTNSAESHPGFIYTQGGRNDQCERNTDTQTHTCVYNLASLNLSHAETYYCAVALCGHMLFVDSSVLVYFLTGSLVFTTIVVLLLVYATYILSNKNHVTSYRATTKWLYRWYVFINQINIVIIFCCQDCQDSDNIHYAALSEHIVTRSRRQTDDTQSECVYSSLRQ